MISWNCRRKQFPGMVGYGISQEREACRVCFPTKSFTAAYSSRHEDWVGRKKLIQAPGSIKECLYRRSRARAELAEHSPEVQIVGWPSHSGKTCKKIEGPRGHFPGQLGGRSARRPQEQSQRKKTRWDRHHSRFTIWSKCQQRYSDGSVGRVKPVRSSAPCVPCGAS